MSNNKWWQGLWEEDSGMAHEILDRIEKLGGRMIAFDFDLTLLDFVYRPSCKLSTEELVKHIRPCLLLIIKTALKRARPAVCVVTWNVVGPLIRRLLKLALPYCDTTSIIVQDNPNPSKFFPISPSKLFLGKQLHLELVLERHHAITHKLLTPRQIFLFDDIRIMVYVAKKNGHRSFHVTDDVSLERILQWLRELQKKKEDKRRERRQETSYYEGDGLHTMQGWYEQGAALNYSSN